MSAPTNATIVLNPELKNFQLDKYNPKVITKKKNPNKIIKYKKFMKF